MYIIAEIAQSHEGSLALALSHINAAKKAGADAVKFQLHIAEAESSEFEPFRVPLTPQDKSRYDYWKRMEFEPLEWLHISDHCVKANIDLVISPFSISALDMIKKMQVSHIKIASGEVFNQLLLDQIGELNLPIIFSSGMSNLKDIENLTRFASSSNLNYSILQCTSAYPTPFGEIGLKNIALLKNLFGCEVGLSDHSGTVFSGFAAAALGASIIEVHVCFSRELVGPDVTSSITFDELEQLVNGCGLIEHDISQASSKKEFIPNKKYKDTFGKSLAAKQLIEKGAIIHIESLETKKPFGYGIPAAEYKQILGRRALTQIESGSFINFSDIDVS